MATEEEMQEQLKNMTPEQIRELQKQQCIFCRIAEGKIPAKKVYEDDLYIAVLDINPGAPGHILVMPKEHYAILPQMPEEVVSHLGMLAKHLSQAVLRGLKAQGTTIIASNGLAAGQRASHFLLHIIPRTEGDGVGVTLPTGSISEDEAKKLQAQMQPFVDRALGKPSLTALPGGQPTVGEQPAAPPAPSVEQQKEEKTDEKEEPREEPEEEIPKGPDLDSLADFLAGDK